MSPPGCNSRAKWPTDDGQTGEIWTPDKRARAQELAMAVGNLGTALALAWWLVCWGLAGDTANNVGSGAWARPAGQVLGGLMAPAGGELAWGGGVSPGGIVQGKKGAELASASK